MSSTSVPVRGLIFSDLVGVGVGLGVDVAVGMGVFVGTGVKVALGVWVARIAS
ncbi:MAG: hypothetical protein ACLFV5_04495 [Anaerolineales bacterium]